VCDNIPMSQLVIRVIFDLFVALQAATDTPPTKVAGLLPSQVVATPSVDVDRGARALG
jgi:hypothetical protein